MKLNYSHIAFQVKDMDAMIRFYCDGLGMKTAFLMTSDDTVLYAEEQEEEPDEIAKKFIEAAKKTPGRKLIRYIEIAPGQFLELFYTYGPLEDAGDPSPRYGYQHLSLQVEDIEAAYRELEAKGIRPDTQIQQGPDYTKQFWIHDPEGNKIELMEYTERSFQVVGNPRNENRLKVEEAVRGEERNHPEENEPSDRESFQKKTPLDIGINTMSLTRLLQSDLEGTVRKLSENGCTNLEPMTDWGAKEETIAFFSQFTGPNAGWNPDVMPERLAILKRYGMKVRGMFIFDECIMEQASDLGKHCAEIGVEYVVFSFLHFDGVEDVYGKICMIKELSKILAPYGVKVLIHNHENDFDRMVDKDGMEKHIVEIFVENTTRDELMLEVDVGWVHYAGIDVAEFVSQHIDRIHVLHLKDIHSNYRNMHHDTVSVACGEGVVDFKAIFAVIPEKEKQRIRLVLDQDSSLGDILEDQIRSLHYFS